MASMSSAERLSPSDPCRSVAADIKPYHEEEDGQSREVDLMAPPPGREFYNTARKPWHKFLDSQEFNGFPSNLEEEVLVAPADELFFQGQLLPLQGCHRLNLMQALTSSGSHIEDEVEARLSVASRSRKHEAVKFSSCRMDSFVDSFELADEDSCFDLRSSSFRSQQSGFWDSTAGDSSSSRDSNGSSQDSFFPTDAPPPPHNTATVSAKVMSFRPWKSLFMERPEAFKVLHSMPIRKYDKTHGTEPLSLDLPKQDMLPGKIKIWAHGKCNIPWMHGVIKGRSKSLCLRDTNIRKGPEENDSEKRKQRNVMETWPHSAAAAAATQSRLKPRYEMKKGIMGQFRMDECGRRAYGEVESGRSIYKSRSPLQLRRLSNDQSSTLHMHDQLQSAVQSAIAHCKQTNNK